MVVWAPELSVPCNTGMEEECWEWLHLLSAYYMRSYTANRTHSVVLSFTQMWEGLAALLTPCCVHLPLLRLSALSAAAGSKKEVEYYESFYKK